MSRDEWLAVLVEAEQFMGGPATQPARFEADDEPPLGGLA